MPVSSKNILAAGGSLLIASLSCTPIMTIGWSELTIIFVVGLMILLPLGFRIIKALRAEDKRQSKD